MKVVGEYKEEFKDEKTGEKIEKTVYLVEPDPPKHEGPILEPFCLPEDEEYFTVERIIELVAQFFGFYKEPISSVSKSETGRKRQRKFEILGNYDSIKRKINNSLAEKPAQKKPNSSKTYSREIVHDFLNDYDHQVWFLEKSVRANMDELKRINEEEGTIEKGLPRSRIQADKDKAIERLNATKTQKEQISKNLEGLKHRLERLYNSGEHRERLVKESLEFLDDYGHNDVYPEIPIDSILKDYKEKILFQFLFESLIDLNEDLLRHDIMILPKPDDGLAMDDEQLLAMLRIRDLHNYYKGKYDLADILKKLLDITKKPQKPDFGTFGKT